MLNVIVFACGAALMALEIVAARVLAPALGNSIFVWGSVLASNSLRRASCARSPTSARKAKRVA